MGKPRIIKKSHDVGFYVMEAYEGKTIEQRCREMVETGEPIKDTSPLIYTPKEKGVRPEYNVRADKWDIAQGAMDAVYRDWETDRKSTRLNSSHSAKSRMPSSA